MSTESCEAETRSRNGPDSRVNVWRNHPGSQNWQLRQPAEAGGRTVTIDVTTLRGDGKRDQFAGFDSGRCDERRTSTPCSSSMKGLRSATRAQSASVPGSGLTSHTRAVLPLAVT